MNLKIELTVPACAIAGILCVLVHAQPANSKKGLKCTYPRVEVVSRQLFIAKGQTVESPVSLTEYTVCDDERSMIESGELLNGDPDIKRVSKYDEYGNEIEHEFWTHGSLTSKSVSRYNSAGRMISRDYGDGTKARCRQTKKQSLCRLFDEKGRQKKRWIITLDSHGREIQRLEYDPPRPSSRYLYAYDQWGNRNQESHYYRDEGKDQNSRSFFTFDDKGKLLQKLWYDESGLRTREVYEYNRRGDLTRRTEYNANKVIVEEETLTYESYDAMGNWNKAVERRTRTDNGKTTLDIRRVLYRTITYPSSIKATEATVAREARMRVA
jgi:hypothetical protein